MTRDQLHIAFKIQMDKNASSIAFGSYPAFLPEEIDYWLNKGMYQEISNKFTGLNTLQQPFEGSVKRAHDLEKLIRVEKNVRLEKDTTLNKCTAIDFFKDKMFFVDCVFRFDTKLSETQFIKHDFVDRFKTTYNNLPYIATPVVTLEDSNLVIYFDPVQMDAQLYSADVTYVKIPKSVEELADSPIPEFPDYMWEEIVNTAVALALENIESPRALQKSQFNAGDE